MDSETEIRVKLQAIEDAVKQAHADSELAHSRITEICNTIKRWLQGTVVALGLLCSFLLANMFF